MTQRPYRYSTRAFSRDTPEVFYKREGIRQSRRDSYHDWNRRWDTMNWMPEFLKDQRLARLLFPELRTESSKPCLRETLALRRYDRKYW